MGVRVICISILCSISGYCFAQTSDNFYTTRTDSQLLILDPKTQVLEDDVQKFFALEVGDTWACKNTLLSGVCIMRSGTDSCNLAIAVKLFQLPSYQLFINKFLCGAEKYHGNLSSPYSAYSCDFINFQNQFWLNRVNSDEIWEK